MDVLSIQARLNALGFNPGPLDGDMGPLTVAAIKRFQTGKQLPVDGLVTPALTAVLFAGVSKSEPAWLAEARKDIGMHEGVGVADNPGVVRMFAEAGHPEIKHDSVAWCAAAVGAWLNRAGIKGTGSLWALDYLKWGQSLDKPILGAIAVKSRDGGGHVTLVVGADRGRVFCLGGNQSDAVNVASYPADVFSYRWPSSVVVPSPPLPLPATITGARAGVKES